MLYLTGIHKASQLRGFDAATWLGRRRRIAIDLIEAIDPQAEDGARQALFEQIVDARMVFKRTYRDRFADFDASLITLLHSEARQPRPLRMLDAAVSDGSTSLPLIDQIDRLTTGEFSFTATDLDAGYERISLRGDDRRRVILSDRGEIVQIVWPPFVFGNRGSRYLFPLNQLFRARARSYADELVRRRKNGDPAVESRQILLLHPELRSRLSSDPRVEFRSWDIMEPWTGPRAHCVRAMNILNPGYFDHAGLARILGNLYAALEDGGLLAVGSNDNAGTPVDGVICRRQGDRLVELAAFGGGFRAPDALARFLLPVGA